MEVIVQSLEYLNHAFVNADKKAACLEIKARLHLGITYMSEILSSNILCKYFVKRCCIVYQFVVHA